MKYGFTLAVVEGRKTIPTLWDTTRDFMARHADLVAAPNLLDFVIGPDGGVPLHLSALGITDGRPPLIQSNISDNLSDLRLSEDLVSATLEQGPALPHTLGAVPIALFAIAFGDDVLSEFVVLSIARRTLKLKGGAFAGADYNLCHFWSNFEMGDLRWFRSEPYQVRLCRPPCKSVTSQRWGACR